MSRVFLILCVIALAVGTALAVPAAAGPAAGAPAANAAISAQRYVIVPGESQAIYRVGEVFLNQNNRFNVAEGTTTAIRGELLIDRANPRNSRIGPITVDMSQFQSDSARRDNAIRDRWLESGRYPTAEFTPAAIEGLPQSYVDGREHQVRVSGTLKIRDVSRPVTFATTLKLDGATLNGVATTQIRMTDFGFDPPSILGVLRSENDVRLEFRFVARRG